MKKTILKVCSLFVSLTFLLQLSGCGTFAHPERQGQPKGDIDPTVVILDGVGLLFFIIPGLVAFLIDFHTGAIYLPPGKTTEERIKELKGSDLRFLNDDGRIVVYFDPNNVSLEELEQIIQTTTGIEFDSDNPELEVYKMDGSSGLNEEFQRLASGYGGRTLAFH